MFWVEETLNIIQSQTTTPSHGQGLDQTAQGHSQPGLEHLHLHRANDHNSSFI